MIRLVLLSLALPAEVWVSATQDWGPHPLPGNIQILFVIALTGAAWVAQLAEEVT